MVGEKTVIPGTQETRQSRAARGGRTLLEKGNIFILKICLPVRRTSHFSHKEKLEHREREGGVGWDYKD